MKFTTITLGCKVNLYETESLTAYLEDKGWKYSTEDVDVCIINTCTVTSTSDQKSRQMIRQARRNNPNAIIVAMGCFVQTHEKNACDIADIIIGTKNRLQVYDLVNEYIETKKQINQVFDINTYTFYDEMKLDRLSNHTRGFIKIQDGCENFCSYCLIPYARGKIKSRNPKNVIDEINTLVNLGTKEIIIAGINTGTYGQDLGNINLAKLIEMIMEETSLYRLRLSSIELMEVSDELLNVMKRYSNRIANHLHIPLQGGSDNTLLRMKRKYNINEYRKLILKIRNMFPNIAITTDCLAGFVGETDKDFNDSLEFIKEMKFSSMHIFPYSRRSGTEADKMQGHLDNSLIKKRARIMIDIASNLKKEYEEKFLNFEFEVLFEQKKKEYWIGHTSNYLEVYLESDEELSNKVIKCKITKMKNNKLFAEEVK